MAHARYPPEGDEPSSRGCPFGLYPHVSRYRDNQPSDLWPTEARRLSGLTEACS